MDLSKLTLAELKDLLVAAKAEEKSRAKSDLEAARNEIYAIAHRMGLPLKDLIGNGNIKKPTGKVVVQYHNPQDVSQEWTGRGRQPNWVKAMVAAGVDLSAARVN